MHRSVRTARRRSDRPVPAHVEAAEPRTMLSGLAAGNDYYVVESGRSLVTSRPESYAVVDRFSQRPLVANAAVGDTVSVGLRQGKNTVAVAVHRMGVYLRGPAGEDLTPGTYTNVSKFQREDGHSLEISGIDTRGGTFTVHEFVTKRGGVQRFVADFDTPGAKGRIQYVQPDGLLGNDDRPTRREVRQVGTPRHGRLQLGRDGHFVYTPDPGFVGTDSFRYFVRGGSGQRSRTATVTLNVVPSSGKPDAVFGVEAGGRLRTYAGDNRAVAGRTNFGSDDLVARGSERSFAVSWPDASTYSGRGGLALSVPAGEEFEAGRVYTTNGLSERPQGRIEAGYDGLRTGSRSGRFSVREIEQDSVGRVLRFRADYELGQYPNVRTDSVEYVPHASLLSVAGEQTGQVVVVSPPKGDLWVREDGTFRYIPADGFFGRDTFTFRVEGGERPGAVYTVAVDVRPADRPPVVPDRTFRPLEDGGFRHGGNSLQGRDDFTPRDRLTYRVVREPEHGRFYFDEETRRFNYYPDRDFDGVDSFEYVASDGRFESEPATVTLDVRPRADAPTLLPADLTATENMPAGSVVGRIAADDPDTGDTVDYRVVGGSGADVFSVDKATGEVRVADGRRLSRESQPESLSLVVEATDSVGLRDTLRYDVNIATEDDRPTLRRAAPFRGVEDRALTLPLASLVPYDPDTPAENVRVVAGRSDDGVVTVDADAGTFTYEPAADFHGEVTLTFTVLDRAESELAEQGLTLADFDAAVSVLVDARNDRPVLADTELRYDPAAAPGDAVFRLNATDDGEELSYALAGVHARRFRVDAETGEVFAATDLSDLPEDAALTVVVRDELGTATRVALPLIADAA